MKRLSAFFIVIAAAVSAKAQYILADTISIRVSQDIEMIAAMENGFKLDSTVNVDRIYRALEKEVPDILSQANLEEVNIRITYVQKDASSEISWTTEQKRYGLNIDSTGNASRIMLNKDTIYMGLGSKMNVSLIFEDISDREALDRKNLDGLLLNARKDLEGDINKHSPFNSNFELKDDESLIRTGFERKNLDQLEIQASIGVGLLRHDITPRVDASVSFDFMNKRSQLHNKLRLNAAFYYSFRNKPEGGTSMFINTFVGVDYAHNFSRKEEALYGLGVHYLVGQNGDIFEGDTWKLNFIYLNRKYRLQIQPELYFTNNFQEAFPGMSILFGF